MKIEVWWHKDTKSAWMIDRLFIVCTPEEIVIVNNDSTEKYIQIRQFIYRHRDITKYIESHKCNILLVKSDKPNY